AKIVGISRDNPRRDFTFLDQIPLIVISVSELPIGQELIVLANHTPSVGPVAIRVIGVAFIRLIGMSGAGQLTLLIVLIIRGLAVVRFACDFSCQIQNVIILGQTAAIGVLMRDVCQVAGLIVAKTGASDELAAGQIRETFDRYFISARVVGHIDAD